MTSVKNPSAESPDELMLLAGLNQALHQSLAEPSPRASVVLALDAIIGFVDSHAAFAEKGLSAPIHALIFAIEDLENGSVAPFLAAQKSDNRHPEPKAKKIMKAYAIICVDYLKSRGMDVPQASRAVAAALEQADYPIDGKQYSTSWKTVKNWRDGNSKLASRDQDFSIVAELRAQAPFPADLTLDEARSHVTQLLCRMVQLIGRYALD